MEWKEKKVSGRWELAYEAVHEGLKLTVNLRRYEYEMQRIQMWDVVMTDGAKSVGRAVIYGDRGAVIDKDKVFTQAVEVMKQHLAEKLAYHHTNYETWKSRVARFSGVMP